MALAHDLLKVYLIVLASGLEMMVSAFPTAPIPVGTNTTSGVPLTTAETEAHDMVKDMYSGVAIALLVVVCIMAAVFMAGLLWLRCSASKRIERASEDVELQEMPRRSRSARPPQESGSDAAPGARPRGQTTGSYERWRKQQDARKKEHRDWVKKKRAEMATMKTKSRNH